MMLDRKDIGAVLATCGGYASDKTPAVSELVVRAWEEHFAQFPSLTRDEVMDAVRQYFNGDPQDRLVQPVDISKIARLIRQDRNMRGGDQVDTEQVQLEAPDQSAWERDGSNYGRFEPVTDTMSIEVRHLESGAEQFRFFWDSPVHQPFVGDWFDVRSDAISDGIRWCRDHQSGPDVTTNKGATEHLPGVPCEEPGCPKPSTFGQWCAKHYCLRTMRLIGVAP